jgi:ammonium transporter, Amt family
MLGKRKDPYGENISKRKIPAFKPHNPFMFTMGTCFIWFGWFAFNGGSTANLSIRSIYVVVNTNLAAMGGATTWGLLDYAYTRKLSLIGVCSGVISGLVGITPAAGFVPVYVAPLVGAATCVTSFFTAKYKYVLGIDEGLDIFAIHGVGGLMGDILTGFFASKNVPAMNGASIGDFEYAGGWWDQHYAQMGYQLAAAVTCAAWSFVISCILLFVINKIPGCRIRATEQEELEGLDEIYLEDGPITGYAALKEEHPGTVTYGIGESIPTGSVLPSEKTEANRV